MMGFVKNLPKLDLICLIVCALDLRQVAWKLSSVEETERPDENKLSELFKYSNGKPYGIFANAEHYYSILFYKKKQKKNSNIFLLLSE